MNHGKDFKILAAINIIYYFCQIVLNILLLTNGMKFRDVGTINRYKNEHNKIFWIWAWFTNQNLPLIYAYYNHKNVQFKRYIFKMLEGRRHRIRFEESSLFIILSWIGRRKIIKLSSVSYHILYIIGRWSEYFLESSNQLWP